MGLIKPKHSEIVTRARDEALEEAEQLFHELYSGTEYPQITVEKVRFFVEKALNNYTNKLLWVKEK